MKRKPIRLFDKFAPQNRHILINSTKKILVGFLRYCLIFCLSFVVLYPLIYMLSMAFRAGKELIDPAVIWIPKQITTDGFKIAMTTLNYWKSLTNSIYMAGSNTIATLIICSITGYGFARFKIRGSKLLFALLIFSIIVPVQTVAIPMFMQIKYFNFLGIGDIVYNISGYNMSIYGTPLALLLPAIMGVGIKGSLFVYIFRQFLKGLPQDLEDAASIDGCGFFKTFYKIIVPTALPPYLVAGILSFIWNWNDNIWIPMYYPKLITLMNALDNFSTHVPKGSDLNSIFVWQRAGAFLVIVPIVIMYMFVQKFFIESVDRTGLK